MKIFIFGTGGVGGYFGGRLAASAEHVTFIARGAQGKALREDGLRIESGRGNLRLRPVKASADAARAGGVDLVLVGMKLWETEAAAQAVAPIVGPDTAVVSFQNGVDAVDIFTQRLGRGRILGGSAHIAAVLERPGVIRHSGSTQQRSFGELDGSSSPRTQALAAACQKAH